MNIRPLAFKPTAVLARLFQGALLFVLMFQLLVIVCLLGYGYIPIPRAWGNALVQKYAPPDCVLQVDAIRIRADAQLEALGLKISSTMLDQPLLVAGMAQLKIGRLPQPSWQFGISGLTVTDGTLYLPAVYSPSGQRSALIEQIACHLTLATNQIRLNSFAARHDQIHIRGTAEWPLSSQQQLRPQLIVTADLIDQAYQHAAEILKKSARFNPFIRPTIHFKLEQLENKSALITARLTSRQLKHPEIIGQDLQVDCAVELQQGQVNSRASMQLQASELHLAKKQLSAYAIKGQIGQEDWFALFQGEWPQLELSAKKLRLNQSVIHAPTLHINPREYPSLRFAGSAGGMTGAASCSGQVNLDTKAAQLTAQGNLDLLSFIPPAWLLKLPQLEFEHTPHFHLDLQCGPNLHIESFQIRAQTQQLAYGGIDFDQLQAAAQFSQGILTVDDFFLRRGTQWLNLNLNLDTDSNKYRLGLHASAEPQQYNSILPLWWRAIFKDFDFKNGAGSSFGNFMIYGSTQSRIAELYFGHVTARNIAYRDVTLQQAELIVRGRGRYTELNQLEAKSGEAWARGNISFSSLPDKIRAPVAIRLKFEAQLPLKETAKLFGDPVAKIINDFDSDYLPHSQFSATIFNKGYPQYSKHTYFDLQADSNGPLRYKQVLLDHLDFSLFGRANTTALREINFGFAGGSGQGRIDINSPQHADTNIRLQLQAKNADKETALSHLAPIIGEQYPKPAAKHNRATELSFQLHATGPATDPLKFTGYGQAELLDPKLASLKLLGPLSKLLQDTPLKFTSLKLDRLRTQFELKENIIAFAPLTIDGPNSRIQAPGTWHIDSQQLNMRVSILRLITLGAPKSPLRHISDFLQSPIQNLLQFDLSGTLDKPRWRSVYDPRNLIPLLK